MFHLHPHRQLQIIGVIFAISWFIGTVLIHRFESIQHWSYFDAFYFTVITTATIGFGDLVPVTIAGKVLTMLYAVFFVPLFLYAMTLMYESRFRKIRNEERKLELEIQEVEANVESILDNTQPEELPQEKTPKKLPRKRIAKK
jgi:voltage-gated potassium channel